MIAIRYNHVQCIVRIDVTDSVVAVLTSSVYYNRADIPCLATHQPFLCRYRNCDYATFPVKYGHQRAPDSPNATSRRLYGKSAHQVADSTWSLIAVEAAGSASRLRSMGKPLGAAFLGVAILVLLLGWRRYVESQFFIIRGKFPASRGSIAIVATAAAALVVTVFVIVLAVDPTLFTSG